MNEPFGVTRKPVLRLIGPTTADKYLVGFEDICLEVHFRCFIISFNRETVPG